jgi:hypothetical protein
LLIYNSFDPASLAILDRLEYLINVVETDKEQQYRSNSSGPGNDTDSHGGNASVTGIGHLTSTTTDGNDSRPLMPTSHSNDDNRTLPYYFHGSSEDILDWPIFQSKHNREQIERLIFNPALHYDADYTSPSSKFPRVSATSPQDGENLEGPRRRMSSLRGIREEDVSELVERFLANVHTKNPILDAGALKEIVQTIAAEGFGWDARSCLVVSQDLYSRNEITAVLA